MGGRGTQSRLSDDLDFQLHWRQREPSADERRRANYPHVRRDDLPMKSRARGGGRLLRVGVDGGGGGGEGNFHRGPRKPFESLAYSDLRNLRNYRP